MSDMDFGAETMLAITPAIEGAGGVVRADKHIPATITMKNKTMHQTSGCGHRYLVSIPYQRPDGEIGMMNGCAACDSVQHWNLDSPSRRPMDTA